MASFLNPHPPTQEPTEVSNRPHLDSPPHHQPRQRSLSSASDSSIQSTESLADSSHSPEDEVATLSVSLLEAINAGDRPRLTDLLATGSPAAIEQVLATFTYPNTDKYYFHEPEILVDANALLGPSTTRLNLIQIACFLGEEELALDIVNHLAREAESVGSKYALKALLASMWGNGNTTLHLASFLGMADLVAKILEVHPALAKKANDRKVKPVDCTDDDVTRMHFFNTPEVNERIADNTLRTQSDGALGLLSSPTTRGRRSDSSASTTGPSRSILSGSRSTDNLKSISNGHNKKRVSFDPLTLWFQGAEQGDLAQLSLFLPSIESVDVRLPSRGATALHLACANGHLGAVKWILDHGADANAADDLGLTALHYAADGLHGDLLLALVDDPRVDVDVVDGDGEGVLEAIDEEEEGGSQLLAKAEIALEVRRTKGPNQGPSAKLATGDLVDLMVPAKLAVKPATAKVSSVATAPSAATRVALASDPTQAKPLTSALKSKTSHSGPDDYPLSMSAPLKLLADLPATAAKSACPAAPVDAPAPAAKPTISPASSTRVPTTASAQVSVDPPQLAPTLAKSPSPAVQNVSDLAAGSSIAQSRSPPIEQLSSQSKEHVIHPEALKSTCRVESGSVPTVSAATSTNTINAGSFPENTLPAGPSSPESLPTATFSTPVPLPNPSPQTSLSGVSTPPPSSSPTATAPPTSAETPAVPLENAPPATTVPDAGHPNPPAPSTPSQSPPSSASHSLSNSANSLKTAPTTAGGHNPSVRPPSPYRLDLHPVTSTHPPSSLVAAAAAMYEQRASTSTPGAPSAVSLSRAASLSVRSLTSPKPSVAAELSVAATSAPPAAPASPGPESSANANANANAAAAGATVSPSGKSRLGVKKEKRASVAASTAAMMANAVEKVNSSGTDGDDSGGGVDATPLASVSERRQFWSFATGRLGK